MSQIQSVLFEKSRWTEPKAKVWLSKHGFKHPKVDNALNYLRFRQRKPSRQKKYTTLTLPGGIKYVLMQ